MIIKTIYWICVLVPLIMLWCCVAYGIVAGLAGLSVLAYGKGKVVVQDMIESYKAGSM